MAKLDHVAFEVTDMDEALDFYVGKLKLPLMFDKVDDIHHERFAFLEIEGGNLELLQVLDEDNQPIPATPNEIRPSNCPHLALVTGDMAQLLAELEEQQIPVVKGPLEIPETVRWIYVHDPDNNVIEFVQWVACDNGNGD